MRKYVVLAAMSAAALLVAVPAGAQLIVQKMLPTALALEAMNAALAACKPTGFSPAVVVVDRYGQVHLEVIGDNARLNVLETARKKAFTAAVRRLSTADYAKQMKDLGRTVAADDPNLTTTPGGLPFIVDGDSIGGIGVSGGKDADGDVACAQAGLAKIADRLK